ncbi:MAG: vWA domain-containing protein [Candidatus Hadarchaeales archaeon]
MRFCRRKQKAPTLMVRPGVYGGENEVPLRGKTHSVQAKPGGGKVIPTMPIEVVILVVDASGSMQESDYIPTRLDGAKAAGLAFLDEKAGIDPRDKVGLVSFSDNAYLDAPHDCKRSKIKKSLLELRANGCTNIGQGLNIAIKELQRCNIPFAVKRIVLLSDGGHNTGTHPDRVLPQAVRQNVPIDTVSIGSADLKLMEKIAAATGGRHVRIEDVESLIARYRQLAEKLPPPDVASHSRPIRVTARGGGRL